MAKARRAVVEGDFNAAFETGTVAAWDEYLARYPDAPRVEEARRARQEAAEYEGHEAVNRAKRERMIRLGDQWAARHPEAQLRYDIVSLYWTGWRFVVTHFPDAFRPVADPQRPWIWRA